jgi:hypothetical protein
MFKFMSSYPSKISTLSSSRIRRVLPFSYTFFGYFAVTILSKGPDIFLFDFDGTAGFLSYYEWMGMYDNTFIIYISFSSSIWRNPVIK